MSYHRRGPAALQGVFVTLFLGIIGAAAVMYLVLRGGLIPDDLLRAGGSVTPTPVPLALYLAGTPTPVAAGSPTVVASRAPTPSGPRPMVDETVARYLKAWEERRYADMHRQLSNGAKAKVPEDAFLRRHQSIMDGATVNTLTFSYPPLRDPNRSSDRVDANFTVVYKTARFGDITEQNTLPLVFEENEWRVDWTPAVIFRDLTGDRKVEVFYEDPVRGNIVDRGGKPLAVQDKLPTVGIIPGQLKDRDKTLNDLAQYLQLKPEGVKRKVDAAQPDWWVPLGVMPREKRDELTQRFGNVPGVVVEDRPARFYPQGATGPHIIGYVSPVLDEDLKTLAARGYGPEDVVGRSGVEAAMEEALAGQRGGRLFIVEPSGETVRVIAERPVKNGANLQLTIDIELQKKAEALLGDKIGSLVLLDPRDNAILAMATNPRIDPNGFITGISPDEWKRMEQDKRLPFQNRPTMSAYPTGSIFKVITAAAGMERGGFKPNSPFQCNGSWSLPGSRIVFGDWVKTGHGALDLTEGLAESCDIVFYEVGRKLDLTDPKILPEYAHLFGLGEATGVKGVAEIPGTLPSPDWKEKNNDHWYPGDAINLAIGQGYLEATPLQMANVYSTLVSGGHLRTPLLIRKIGPAAGNEPVQEFKAEERRQVPLSPTTLATIKEAMKRVTSTPKGTAFYAFNGFRIPSAGKTGSAENQHSQAHAWFAGYAPLDDPQVVAIVMVEGGEMGGVVAAPLGRQAFEAVLGR
ncbi:MAG TPA: penicillin-binding protein 2 [Chloroflexota bacterium]